jgi:SAM-dependent methyltransferase
MNAIPKKTSLLVDKASLDSNENMNTWHKHVIGTIHPNDDMLFKLNGKRIEESYIHYNKVGLSALSNIEQALELAGKKFDDINHCLDIPCGYGRVLRMLQTKIDSKKITACELNEEALRFCSSEFKVNTLLSNTDFKNIEFKEKYDLIWVGSLFTHLDQKSFLNLLEVLYFALENKGVLVFTTHGKYSAERTDKKVYGVEFPKEEELLKILETEGYYYSAYEHCKEYGISICLPDFVFTKVNSMFGNNIKFLMHKYRGWDNHQDVYAYQRL